MSGLAAVMAAVPANKFRRRNFFTEVLPNSGASLFVLSFIVQDLPWISGKFVASELIAVRKPSRTADIRLESLRTGGLRDHFANPVWGGYLTAHVAH
jgi:hypothetical protein